MIDDQNRTNKTPPNAFNIPLVHKICEFYKKIYLLGLKLPKRDKLGLHSKIENFSLELFNLIIEATFEVKRNKLPYLNSARIKIELLKRLLRTENELHILLSVKYLELESNLQEISKMTNGWIRYLAATQ